MNAEKRGKMTVAQMAKYIGRTGFLSYDRMLFEVMVTDVRQSWGDIHVLVVPSSGGEKQGIFRDRGASWKSVSSVQGLEIQADNS